MTGVDDPTDLDRQYNLRGHPDREAAYAEYAERSVALRQRLAMGQAEIDVPYADHPRAKVDVYHASHPRAVMVFFHGGYWRALDKSIFGFLAAPFLSAGYTVVMPGYPLAPEVSIPTIVEHARAALAWTAGNERTANLPIIVSGHSAGGHLAAMCILAPPTGAAGPAAERIVGSVPVSGLFDLDPLRMTNVNIEARMDEATAFAMSPSRLDQLRSVPTFLIVGGAETVGFRWQSEHYAKTLRVNGTATVFEQPVGLNHFTVLGPLADPSADLHQRVSGFIESCVESA